MHDIAMRIAKNLAFDMAGALDQLFEIDLVLAEGGLRLALGFRHFPGQILRIADGAHAASAAAPGGLEHDRIADLLGHASRPPSMSSGSGSVAGTTGTPT